MRYNSSPRSKQVLPLSLAAMLVVSVTAVASNGLPVRMMANAGNPVSGETSLFDITISEWTSEVERQDLLATIESEGSTAVRGWLQGKESKGRIAARSELGIALRYAYRIERAGGSTVFLAADRPVDVEESIGRGLFSKAYENTLVVLELDEQGRGNGTLMIGAEIGMGPDGELRFKSASPEPLRLGDVRLTSGS